MHLPEMISLTDDVDQRAKLQRKLEEYRQRAAARPNRDAAHKARVLAELLDQGGVAVADLRDRMSAEQGFDEHHFANAVKVVEAYNANETAILAGGTRLV